jgi:hypothetical protein
LTQVPCAGFFIDLVTLDNDGRRLAIECDGEFHYDDDNELRPEDYQRQDIIERSGWTVCRVSTRRFYANPGECIESVVQELKAQSTETDLIGGDISPNVEEQEEIPIQADVPNGNLSPAPPVKSLETHRDSYVPSLTERPAAAPVQATTLGDGPIGLAANWMKLNRWGWINRKLNRYISWYCYDIAKRLTKGDKMSGQGLIRAREIWEMAHKLGFDENQ